jgi:tetratricopeptide (TPR) repeat protein
LNIFDKMLRLKAYNTYHAASVFETEKGLFFVEYPYSMDQVRRIMPEQLHYLVHRLEFVPCDVVHENYTQLVEFVKEKAESARSKYQSSSMTEEELIVGLESYPEASLANLLDDLKERYLEAGKLAEARLAMDRYWRVQAIANHRLLRAKLILMEQFYEDALETLNAIQKQPSENAFPAAYKAFGDKLREQLAGFKSLVAA